MFEKRPKGNDLAKIISYAYLVLAVSLAIIALIANMNTSFSLTLGSMGVTFTKLVSALTVYLAYFIVVYGICQKFNNSENIWILYVFLAVAIILIFGFNIILIILSILLLIAANDIRKELN